MNKSKLLFQGKNEGNGFWLGNPSVEAKKNYFAYFGIKYEEHTDLEKHNLGLSVLKSEGSRDADFELAEKLQSDFMMLTPEFDPAAWKHPEGKPLWNYRDHERESLAGPGRFANTEDVSEVEAFKDWPNPDYIDLSNVIHGIEIAEKKDLGVLSGMFCRFFPVLSEFFGIENYFMKMIDNPAVVHAVTEKVVNFYLESNKKVLGTIGNRLMTSFFGNDLGTQRSMFISLELFDEFVGPYLKRLIDQMKSFGLKVTMHSCGAISGIIPRLIDMGVDALHPLQAMAVGMDAITLAREYGKDLIFIGGVDTQELLPFKSPKEVREEVLRLRDIFKDRYIVSPSHEALLANVSIENVVAMSNAARE